MEMQYADYTEFVSTSHDFLEDVMNVLDTEQPQYHLVCNTARLRGCMCLEKNRIGSTLGASLGTLLGKSKKYIVGCN